MPCDSVACVKMCGGDDGDGESGGSSIPCARNHGCSFACYLCDDNKRVVAEE